ncbi:MAG: hypothetical protein PWP31_629 [Clostridia bacterium]|nr:hypothetical protein [Clostridia bacterium]
MEVYNLAHELARSLAKSDQYKEFRLAKAKLESDSKNLEMFRDFRGRQMALQMAVLSGKEPDESEKKALEESYRVVSLNPTITSYLASGQRLAQLMQDIQKILIDAIPEWGKDMFGEIDKK